MEIIIASRNLHKIREIKSMLKGLKHVDPLSLLDFPDYIPPAEVALTLEENVRTKALSAARLLNKWVVADDSGLFVPALSGAPGVRSARFAGESASDKENRTKLLHEMARLTDLQRGAYFECWLALASPHEIKSLVRGRSEGSIALEERGMNGFGYDPIFLKHEYGKTFAELEEEVKNRISHRRKAMDKLLPSLERAALKNS